MACGGLCVAALLGASASAAETAAPAAAAFTTSATVALPLAMEAHLLHALPAEARAKPARPRHLLIYTATRGFRHGSIECGARAFTLMGQRTGAYTATVSADPEAFAPANLAAFDAVLLLNTTGPALLPANYDALTTAGKTAAQARDGQLKASLLSFVEGGGGLIGIHAATDLFYEWPAYAPLIGGKFAGHPWHEQVAIELVEPAHPLLEVFGGRGFSVTDEIYQFGPEYSPARLRELLRLDPAKINRAAKGIARQDDDFAVSWVRRAGKRRVFYNSLGHREEIYWNPQVMRYNLAGVQYALGDLAVPDQPRAVGDGAP